MPRQQEQIVNSSISLCVLRCRTVYHIRVAMFSSPRTFVSCRFGQSPSSTLITATVGSRETSTPRSKQFKPNPRKVAIFAEVGRLGHFLDEEVAVRCGIDRCVKTGRTNAEIIDSGVSDGSVSRLPLAMADYEDNRRRRAIQQDELQEMTAMKA